MEENTLEARVTALEKALELVNMKLAALGAVEPKATEPS